MSASQTQPSPTTHPNDSEPLDKPGPLSLDQLPTEIIEEIVQHLQWRHKRSASSCPCRNEPLRLSSCPSPRALFSKAKRCRNPDLTFSCASKRYREISLQTKEKTFDLCYSDCCRERVLSIPKEIRADVTYVTQNPTDIAVLLIRII